jgi:tRNA 2-selenouridine synthase
VIDYCKPNNLIIDLRSEDEYSKGHIPFAVNVPLLNNEERKIVGTAYKQQGKQIAVSIGIELFAKKAESFFTRVHDLFMKSRLPLKLYCWRGGMRSVLTSKWLQALGIDNDIFEGGYKKYRKYVCETLDLGLAKHSLVVLQGYTGSGKTQFLQALKQKDIPTIDFESLACHKGSAFGAFAEKAPSPSQQQFENNICFKYLQIRHHPTIVVELEGVIGPVIIPKNIRQNIRSSPMVILQKSIENRVDDLQKTYCQNWDLSKEQKFNKSLLMLQKKLAKNDYQKIISEARKHNFAFVIRSLLEKHYDKSYQKSICRYSSQTLASFSFPQEFFKAVEFFKQRIC